MRNLILSVALLVTTAVTAQVKDVEPIETDRKELRKAKFEEMKSTLDLTEEQAVKVKALFKEQRAEKKALHAEKKEMKEEQKKKRTAIRKERNSKMKEILSEEQMDKYLEMEKARAASRKAKKDEKKKQKVEKENLN